MFLFENRDLPYSVITTHFIRFIEQDIPEIAMNNIRRFPADTDLIKESICLFEKVKHSE